MRAGKDLTPKPWPGDNRVAVGLSFELDNEAPSLRDSSQSPSELSQGEYGSRVARGRILALLDKHQIKASFLFSGRRGFEEQRTRAEIQGGWSIRE